MSRRNFWVLTAAIVISLLCYSRATRNPYGRWLAQAMDTIENQYIEPVDAEKLFEGAMRGMVGRLDDYSSFLPRSLKTYFDDTLKQKYGGIGIEVALTGPDKQLTVMSSRVGTPAYEAGILPGDRIVGIDDTDTESFAIDDALRLLRGDPGTPVKLRVRREGHESPLSFDLTRAEIRVDSVLGDVREKDGSWNFMLPGDEHIGYVRVTSFGDLTVEEFEAALQWLSQRQCRGLVLDLRDNPGGLLDAAEEICELFLPEGAVIVTTRGRDAQVRDELRASGQGPYQKLPIVVLVNGQTASAGEIVAACLQDHQRAKVVGERSFGKGTVQHLIPVEAGQLALKLTIATYWRPSEKNIHRLSTSKDSDEWGVQPDADCAVKLSDAQTTAWHQGRRKRDGRITLDDPAAAEPSPGASQQQGPLKFDPQLERAIEVMRQELAQPSASSRAA